MLRAMKIIIILLVIIVAASGIFMLAVRRRQAPSAATPQDAASLVEAARSNEAPSAPASPVPPPSANLLPAPVHTAAPAVPADPALQLAADLQQIAKSFTERWGTHASDQDISPVASLFPLMTVKMQAYARTLAAPSQGGIFYSVQTRALNVQEQILEADAGTARYLVATQRVEIQGSASNRKVSYQGLEVRLRKEDGLWKVDGAFWSPVKVD